MRSKAELESALPLVLPNRFHVKSNASYRERRGGANFSPSIAKAYSLAIDSLSALVTDVIVMANVFRAPADFDDEEEERFVPALQDFLSLALFLEQQEVFGFNTGLGVNLLVEDAEDFYEDFEGEDEEVAWDDDRSDGWKITRNFRTQIWSSSPRIAQAGVVGDIRDEGWYAEVIIDGRLPFEEGFNYE